MDMEFYAFQELLGKSNNQNGVFARFYDKTVRSGKIADSGLPELKTVVYVEIRIKDNPDIFDQPADETYFKRFPLEYSRYQMEKKQIAEGTALSAFAFLSIEQLETCEFRGIFTVEALATLDDTKAKDLGLVTEKELAQKFLEVSKNNKAIDDFVKKENEYMAKIQKLEEELEALKKSK